MTKNLAGTNIPNGNGGVVYPSPNEWPIMYIAITGITNGLTTTVTAPNHGFTTGALPQIQVDFSQVKGMTDINGVFAYVSQVVDANNFVVPINSTNFHPYVSGGFVNILAYTGSPQDPFTNTFP